MRAIRSAGTVSAAGCSCTFPSAVAAVENLIDCMSWRTCALQLNQQRTISHIQLGSVLFAVDLVGRRAVPVGTCAQHRLWWHALAGQA